MTTPTHTMQTEITIAPGASTVLDRTLSHLVRIPDWLYEEIKDRLLEAIGCRDYFCGTISFPARRIRCRLTIAVIVCRHRVSYPEGEVDEIKDLVPVWWEFHTYDDGEERSNNFLFSELKKYI